MTTTHQACKTCRGTENGRAQLICECISECVCRPDACEACKCRECEERPSECACETANTKEAA